MTDYGIDNLITHFLPLIWCTILIFQKLEITENSIFSGDGQLWMPPTDEVLQIQSWDFREVIGNLLKIS